MTDLILGFPTETGVRRLLQQPADIVERREDIAARKPASATVEHRQLFDDYLADLNTALEIAGPWWSETVNAQITEGMELAGALQAAYTKRLAGPASHPNFVWIIRNYWLDVDDVNQSLSDAEIVYPETLMLQWLVDAGRNDLVALVACMPYWPIGLDEDGNWC